jgi:polypyrimidine tract-binding protein 2
VHPRPDGALLAWALFQDAAAAGRVRAALHGKQIPSSVVAGHPAPPRLDVSFCTHPDLPIKAQSPVARDFTAPQLPWGPPDPTLLAALLPSSGANAPSNVVSVTFDNMTYPVDLDGLHTVFSTYGFVQKAHVYERDGRTVALVQYPDVGTATTAKRALEGHAMYGEGHNVMRLVFSKHRDLNIKAGERSRDYTRGPGGFGGGQGAGFPGGMGMAGQGSGGGVQRRPGSPGGHVTGDEYVRAHERALLAQPAGPPPRSGGGGGGGYYYPGPPGPYHHPQGGYGGAPPPGGGYPPGGYGGPPMGAYPGAYPPQYPPPNGPGGYQGY